MSAPDWIAWLSGVLTGAIVMGIVWSRQKMIGDQDRGQDDYHGECGPEHRGPRCAGHSAVDATEGDGPRHHEQRQCQHVDQASERMEGRDTTQVSFGDERDQDQRDDLRRRRALICRERHPQSLWPVDDDATALSTAVGLVGMFVVSIAMWVALIAFVISRAT